jgi:succinate dehydrogenase / fumarate reductase cytochrome b subunit
MNALRSQDPSSKQKTSFLRSFLQRRLHSLMGLFLVLFLCEHLLTNSQAALWIGEDGKGFVQMVNFIHSLPYLPVIEWFLLGMPILIHAFLGVKYLKEAHYNSVLGSRKGDAPYFNYSMSKAYTWQRLTAWFLMVGILAHVIHLRVLRNPQEASLGSEKRYLVSISPDEGLERVADRVGATLVIAQKPWQAAVEAQTQFQLQQREEQLKAYEQIVAQLQKSDRLIVASSSFGTAMLLVVRDVFKNIGVCVLYTLFVLSAVYHASHGLWSAMIAWGVTQSTASQNALRKGAQVLMGTLALLGFAAIWLSYWVNLID